MGPLLSPGRPTRSAISTIGSNDLVVGEDHMLGPSCLRYNWQTGRCGSIAFGSSPRREYSDFKPPLSCGSMHLWKRLQEITSRKNQEWISFSGDLINEIQGHINLASSALGRLSKCVFGKQNLTIHANITVYDAVVISTILYGCETCVPYRRHIRLLESFHTRCLQLILGLRW